MTSQCHFVKVTAEGEGEEEKKEKRLRSRKGEEILKYIKVF